MSDGKRLPPRPRSAGGFSRTSLLSWFLLLVFSLAYLYWQSSVISEILSTEAPAEQKASAAGKADTPPPAPVTSAVPRDIPASDLPGAIRLGLMDIETALEKHAGVSRKLKNACIERLHIDASIRPKALDRLIEDTSWTPADLDALRFLLRHPAAREQTLRRFAQEHAGTALLTALPGSRVDLATLREAALGDDPDALRWALDSQRLDDKYIAAASTRLLAGTPPDEYPSLAASVTTPRGLLAALADTRNDPATLSALANNPRTPAMRLDGLLSRLLAKGDTTARQLVHAHRSAAAAVMRVLRTSAPDDFATLRAIARHRRFNGMAFQQLLRRLARDRSSETSRVLGMQLATPADILSDLVDTAADEPLLNALARHPNLLRRDLLAIAASTRLPPSTTRLLLRRGDAEIERILAANPAVPTPERIRLSRDARQLQGFEDELRDRKVARALAENPFTPEATLLKIATLDSLPADIPALLARRNLPALNARLKARHPLLVGEAHHEPVEPGWIRVPAYPPKR